MHISTFPPLFNAGVIGAASAVALRRGRGRERAVAVLQLLLLLAAFYPIPPLARLVLLVAEFLGCLAYTAVAASYWAVWASGAYALAVAVAAVAVARRGLAPAAAQSAEWMFCYAAALALSCGVLRRPRRARSDGGGAPPTAP